MLQTDELYIRMNSRGKPLTRFEHFKAQLSQNLKEIDESLEKNILNKIDGKWTDTLWKYKDEKNLIDTQFLNFFKFICDVIRFESNTGSFENYDEFILLKKYFSKDNMNATSNVKLLEKYLDSIADLLPDEPHPTEKFLSKFLSLGYGTTNKITIDTVDLIGACFTSYTKRSGKTRQFTYSQMVLLYAIMQYLTKRDCITEEDFARRLRIINNLVNNSDDELTEREKNSRLSAIFKQTAYIMETGKIEENIDANFNSTQLEEEAQKIEWLKSNPSKKDLLYKLENHPRLYGRIGIIGLDDIELTDKFIELFKCDYNLIDCALMTIGFYGQSLKSEGYYQLGSTFHTSWNNLLHNNNNLDFNSTSKILKTLLRDEGTIDDKTLSRRIEEYTSKCEKDSLFPLNYYYVKYKEFRPNRYGKYYIPDLTHWPYKIIVLVTENRLSPSSYSPYLYEIDKNRVPMIDNGQRLVFDNVYIQNYNSSFLILRESDNTKIDEIKIQQDKGIDTEDRIIKLRNYLIDHDYIED